MFTLRLFRQDEPFLQVQARQLAGGVLSVGRDKDADWPIDDPTRTLSRLHCTFALEGGALTLRDVSANGVFIGEARLRAPAGEPVPVPPGDPVRLGDFIILAEAEAEPIAEPAAQPRLRAVKPGPAPDRPPPGDASLMEAFCAGAGLDASAFSGEDPALVMRRLGAVYQQMVGGLAALMNDRVVAKSDFHLERTTVRAGGNNPFRWAPAERVAVDLLRPRDDGFLSGPGAVQMSFEDLRTHLVCTLAGARAAVAGALRPLDPEAIENAVKDRPFSLKSRSAEAWSAFVEAYAGLSGDGLDDPSSSASLAFREAYEREQEALGSGGTVL